MQRSGALLPTLVIAALGVTGSLLGWNVLERAQQFELERDAQASAAALGREIEIEIERELDALRRRADRWALEPPASSDEWRSRAEFFLSEHPGYRALVRMDGGAASDVVASEEGRSVLREVAPKVAEHMSKSDVAGRPRELAVGPIDLSDGRAVFGIQLVTAGREEQDLRVLFAVLDPGRVLEQTLGARKKEHPLRVRVGTRQVYPTGVDAVNAASSLGSGEWTAEALRLSLGSEWSVLVQPSGAEGADRNGPTIALVAGLAISALIASLVHVSQTSRSRAAALAGANLDLHERMSVSARDEAEIRRLNEALEARVLDRTAALQETIAELETFNYSVSHDLRSPLGAILNFAAILAQDYGGALDANGREYLTRISGSARAAVSLMDGLLAFSRSGRDELRKTRVDVQQLVESVRDEQVAARPEQTCHVQVAELPPVDADPAMLRLIFANLLANACKFVRPGEPPHVEIGGYVEGGDAVYFVRDQGIGFDMRFADKLFGVFERLHARDEYDGHGVGLAIVARLARRHGGQAWAEGAVGKGATFYIRLPVLGGSASRGLLYV